MRQYGRASAYKWETQSLNPSITKKKKQRSNKKTSRKAVLKDTAQDWSRHTVKTLQK
jgi:hypothetical protein